MVEVIDPEIRSFSEWFRQKSAGDLMGLEVEILRAYLYYKLYGEV